MSALRWWLLILGVAFFAGLVMWELRRPRQARSDTPPEPTRPREPTLDPPLQLPEMHAREPLTGRSLPVVELPELPEDDAGEFPVLTAGVPDAAEPAPPEAAHGLAHEEADFDVAAETVADAEALAAEAVDALEEASSRAAESAANGDSATTPVSEPRVEWPPDDQRRVVALRLVAPQPERFAGRSLRQALAAEGFVLGRFDIFHKADDEQRAVLSAASLTQPGTFDPDTMDSQHFGGLSLFAVLPGPKSPPEAFEELVSTARSLNDRLCGVLQDEGGTPLTPQRIASLKARLNSGAPA